MSSPAMPEIALNTGAPIPRLGFGVFAMGDATTASSVVTAIESGYRSIDTAAVYGNERGVGEGIRRSGVDRDDVFVTTKLWNADHLDVERAFAASLDRLGLDYVDLYLIHWPVSVAGTALRAWEAMQALVTDGRARAIGVSNFNETQILDLIDHGFAVPAVNQIELHPLLVQTELTEFHADHGIVTQAWSPLGRGLAFGLDTVAAIAARHGVSEAQVVLRWHLQRDIVPLPKSASAERIRENIDILGFTLRPDEVAAITALNSGQRVDDSYYEWA